VAPALAVAGLALLPAAAVLEPRLLPGAAIAFAAAAALALGVARRTAITWPYGIAALLVVMWLVPIRGYALPAALPFRLEPYRLVLAVLLVALGAAVVTGRARLSAAGHGKPLALLVIAAVAGTIANRDAVVASAGSGTQAIKTLSLFLSVFAAFVLITSVLRNRAEVDTVIVALVLVAIAVALAALYESRTRTNLFGHLDQWVPGLDRIAADTEAVRGGRLRVRASAQHPIALGAALAMCVPLALYLASRAATTARRYAWMAGGALLGAGAVATVSRTVVLMLAAMVVAGLLVRRRSLLRHWPLALVVVVAVHLAAPSAISGLRGAFAPSGGLVAEQSKRSGADGSGRLSDLGPALQAWKQHPIAGRGLVGAGTRDALRDPAVPGEDAAVAATPAAARADDGRTIYDDQYLLTLTALGLLGLVGAVWAVWGAVVTLGRAARRRLDGTGDLAAACAVSCAGFGVGMATFDAFSFVQVFFLAFVVAALGLAAVRGDAGGRSG
jgi:hypothetical protein